MKTAIYARVSTDDQSTESQLIQCREWCQRNGIASPVEFLDTASGALASRKHFDRMMEQVRKGSIKTIICYKIDRIGRSVLHLVQFFGELTSHGTSLVCLSQGIDTRIESPSGMFQIHILAAVAQFERSLIKERTKAGIQAARGRGVRIGRPPGSKLKITRAQCLNARERGLSWRQAGKELGVSDTSVRRMLAGNKTANA